MNMFMKILVPSLLGGFATAAATTPLPQYTLIEIPSIVAVGGTMSASAINDSGEVVGTANQAAGAPYYAAGPYAFSYQPSTGAINELISTTFGPFSAAAGINDNGMIVGNSSYSNEPPQAVVWTPTSGAESINPELPSFATAVNTTLQRVVGSYECNLGGCAAAWDGSNHVFSAFVNLPADYCPDDIISSSALAVNKNDNATGWANGCDIPGGAVLWRNSEIQVVAPNGVGTGINDSNDVVGLDQAGHAFWWHFSTQTLQDLGTLPGYANSSEAYAINDHGEIVGTSTNIQGNSHAFVYLDGKMYDLNTLVNDPSVTLTSAVGVNINGWIAANGITTSGQYNAYLLKVK